MEKQRILGEKSIQKWQMMVERHAVNQIHDWSGGKIKMSIEELKELFEPLNPFIATLKSTDLSCSH